MNPMSQLSNNETSFLKFNGPFKLASSDNSFQGQMQAQVYVIVPMVVGVIKSYEPISSKEPSIESQDQEKSPPE